MVVDVPVTRADAVPFSGSSYCCAAAVATAAVLIPAMAVEMTAAFGLSCFSSAAADAETAAAVVQSTTAAADADDYKRNLRYDEDLYGLQDFLDACSDARDDCTVALTKDSKGKIVRICAIAG